MIICGIYLYIIIGHIRKIFICYIQSELKDVTRLTHILEVYRINFHLLSYEFKISFYLDFGMRWESVGCQTI